MTKYYPEVNSNPDFPKIEEKVLAYWKKEDVFQKSVSEKPAKINGKNNEFVFYDGPPFANGLPHYGHLLTGFVKDIFARYQTMQGKRVERRFGWDCHGLPAEMGAEKELGISGRFEIEKYGIDKFNDACRTSVMKYTNEWEQYVTRQARWVDFKNSYKTMDKGYMESVLWAFKQLWDKGLVYESMRVMPYSWACETPLSNFETRMDNSYRERMDKAVTVAFELDSRPEGAPQADKYYLCAWTTTPWTLPSNLALAVNKDIEYACVLVEKDSPSLRGGGNLQDQGSQQVTGGVKPLISRGYSKDTLEFSQNLRRELTPEEKKLWHSINSKQLGFKFRKQQPIGKYTADFYCPELALILELDGGQHAENKEYDDERTKFLESQGYKVLRFWNNEVNKNIEGVLSVIQEECSRRSKRVEDLPLPESTSFCSADATHGLADSCHPSGGGLSRLKVCYIMAESSISKYEKELNLEQPYMRLGVVHDKNLNPIVDKYPAEDEYTNRTSEELKKNRILGHIKGSALAGLIYTPLFPYFASKKSEGAFRILDGSSFVTEGDGTGVVHIAPGFGEDDFEISKKENVAGLRDPKVQVVCPVDNAGRYTDEIFDITTENHPDLPPLSLKGLNVIADTNKSENEPYKPEQLEKNGLVNLRIIKWLSEVGKLIKQEDYKHNYPHCWRTDTPLIYKAVPSWYVEVTKFKDRMVELNHENINWIPDHIRDGQFGKWLENARDWSISRNRYWGSPIPVWKSDNPKSKEPLKAFGSIKELEEFFNEKIEDLHRPFIDNLVKADDDEQPENPRYFYKRVSDVFDCWFESGSMPFAQVHYPFENKDWFENHFPADFIVEYVAQTRGWFYTLMVLSTAIFDRPPFLNCICHGVVLDDKGQKLSKRLNNYADPMEIFNKFGADAMRWVMISAPIMNGGELLIDKEGNMVRDAVRLVLKPVWNAYNFFTLYANADGVEGNYIENVWDAEKEIPMGGAYTLMDDYILQKTIGTVKRIKIAMDSYDTPTACRLVEEFFEVLNNWYIRRSKERFWKSEKDTDKKAAYDTLYTVLHIMCRAMAPLLPLVTEEIWQGLTSLRGGEADVAIHTEENKERKMDCHTTPAAALAMTNSIHVQDFPKNKELSNEINYKFSLSLLNMHVDRVRNICNAALAIRSAENIRVRQPLSHLTIIQGENLLWSGLEDPEYKKIIEDEVNVKEVIFKKNVLEYADYKLKINFQEIGKRLPTKVKDIIAASKQNQWKLVSELNEIGDGIIEIAGETLSLNSECWLLLEPKNKKGAQALSSNDALVILDLKITDELKIEGIYRDLVRIIQQSRKDANLNIIDRISLNIETANDDIKDAISKFNKDIAEQTLAVSVEVGDASSHQHHFTQKLEGNDVVIGFGKVA